MLRGALVSSALVLTVAVQACSGDSPPSSTFRNSDSPVARQSTDRPAQPVGNVSASPDSALTVTVTDGIPGDCEPSPPDPNAVVLPRVLSRTDPVLPTDVPGHGLVVLDVVLSRSGQIEDARVRRSFRPDFDKACIEAVRQWRFQPATQKGIPVTFDFTMRCEFSPQEQPTAPSGPL